jgi:hypothetical protein
MQRNQLSKIMRDLDDVNAKLKEDGTQSSARLDLLRLQAALGDRRDAALDAARRKPEGPR